MQQKANKESGAEGAQIDLVLDRRDQVIKLCEMKYSLKPYDITPNGSMKLADGNTIYFRTLDLNVPFAEIEKQLEAFVSYSVY